MLSHSTWPCFLYDPPADDFHFDPIVFIVEAIYSAAHDRFDLGLLDSVEAAEFAQKDYASIKVRFHFPGVVLARPA